MVPRVPLKRLRQSLGRKKAPAEHAIGVAEPSEPPPPPTPVPGNLRRLSANGLELRLLALPPARQFGRVYRWLNGEARPLFLGLALMVVGLWLADGLFDINDRWFGYWQTAAATALLGYTGWIALNAVLRARQRIVIEQFTDHTGDEAARAGKMLSALLPHELHRLRNVYRPADDPGRPRTTHVENERYRSMQSTFAVGDVGTSLQAAVSADAKVSVGRLEIPLGALLAIAGKIAQGPRLVGTIYVGNDGRRCVVARMAGGNGDYSWRVEEPVSASGETGEEDALRITARELACRIFSDHDLGGSHPWRATAAFVEGVRAYSRVLRTPPSSKRTLELKKAERRFLDTLAEDSSFEFAGYNLGLVYWGLGREPAAERAFLREISKDPGRWQPYYALARLRYLHLGRSDKGITSDRSCEAAIDACERVIKLADDKAAAARAYDLKGLAEREIDRVSDALKSREHGVRLAWRALVHAELAGESFSGAAQLRYAGLKELMGSCLTNLAVVTAHQARATGSASSRRRLYGRAARFMRRAIDFSRIDDELFFELGRIYEGLNEADKAREAYAAAVRSDPNSALFRAYLAVSYARGANGDERMRRAALNAAEQALDCPSELDDVEIAKVAEAYDLLGEAERANRVRSVPAFLKRLEKAREEEGQRAWLEATLREAEERGNPWEEGQVHVELGGLFLFSQSFRDPARARRHLRAAIGCFEQAHPGEIREKGLRALVARTLREVEGCEDEALKEAWKALVLDPLSAYERNELGEVFFARSEYDNACEAWELSVLLSPSQDAEGLADLHLKIGMAYWRTARGLRDPARRSLALKRATKAFVEALDLVEQAEQRWSIHYWLGRLFVELGDYVEAIPHFEKAQNTGGNGRLLTTLRLAQAYVASKDYDMAMGSFERLIYVVDALDPGETIDAAEFDDSLPTALLVASSYVGLALSLAERNVELRRAGQYLRRARKITDGLPESDELRACRAERLACEGWILYLEDRADEAIARLSSALALAAEPRTCLRLARVYARKLESGDRTDPRLLVRRGLEWCDLAEELDIQQLQGMRLKELRERLLESGRAANGEPVPSQELLEATPVD